MYGLSGKADCIWGCCHYIIVSRSLMQVLPFNFWIRNITHALLFPYPWLAWGWDTLYFTFVHQIYRRKQVDRRTHFSRAILPVPWALTSVEKAQERKFNGFCSCGLMKVWRTIVVVDKWRCDRTVLRQDIHINLFGPWLINCKNTTCPPWEFLPHFNFFFKIYKTHSLSLRSGHKKEC